MAKSKINIPSILEAVKEIKKSSFKPVYCFCGEDSFGIDSTYKLLEEKIKPYITSEFDKEIFYGEDKNMVDILDIAAAFPFGSDKKLIVLREFEKVKDKKNLLQYISSPVEFTILVLIHNGQISNPDTELYRKLLEAGFLYEAKELKGKNLTTWLINYAESKGKILTEENAQLFVDIAGDNRSMLEVQLEKIFTFIGDKKEIDHTAITNLSSSLKQYSIFDLQNAIGKKDKANALKIGLKMIDDGAEPIFIIFMLTRYFTGLSRMNELKEKNIPTQAAARIVGTHQFFYKDYENARKLYSDEKVYNAAQALLKADLSVKTTSADPKNVVSVLIGEIMQ